MLPASTDWLPNFFTPRRRPAESRPLRELPPAFLCAISNYSSDLLFVGLLGAGILGRLLRRCFLRGGLLVGGLGGRSLLDRLRLLRLGFLLHLDALGRLLALGLVRGRRGFRRCGLDLRSRFLRRRGLLFRLRVADLHDAQQRHLLAVTRLAAIVVPPTLLEHDDLFALCLRDDLGRDGYLAGIGQLLAVAGEED